MAEQRLRKRRLEVRVLLWEPINYEGVMKIVYASEVVGKFKPFEAKLTGEFGDLMNRSCKVTKILPPRKYKDWAFEIEFTDLGKTVTQHCKTVFTNDEFDIDLIEAPKLLKYGTLVRIHSTSSYELDDLKGTIRGIVSKITDDVVVYIVELSNGTRLLSNGYGSVAIPVSCLEVLVEPPINVVNGYSK